MDGIIRRLLESNNHSRINTSLFDIKNNSDEAWDLYSEIESLVAKNLPDNVDLDDSGLDSRGRDGDDKTVIYKGSIFVFDPKTKKPMPVPSKVVKSLEKALDASIRLPRSDEDYDYKVDIRVSSGEVKIVFRREVKW